MMKLGVSFKSPTEARQQLGIGVSHETQSSYSPVHIQVVRTYTPSNIRCGSSLDVTKTDPFSERIYQISNEDQIELLGDLFCSFASQMCGVSIPVGFIKLSLHGMQCLQPARQRIWNGLPISYDKDAYGAVALHGSVLCLKMWSTCKYYQYLDAAFE